MAYRGKYKVKNLAKYVGDPSKVRFLSLWEYAVCKHFDNSPEVLRWNSEDVHVRYANAAENGKMRTYMVDFYVEMTNGKKYLIEVKPFKQTQAPKQRKKITKGYLAECYTYAMNLSKWDAARKLAELNGIEFLLWTENELHRLGIKTL